MLDLEVVPEQGLQTEQWELILGEKMEKKNTKFLVFSLLILIFICFAHI